MRMTKNLFSIFTLFSIIFGIQGGLQTPNKVDARKDFLGNVQESAPFAVTKRLSVNAHALGGNDKSYSTGISGDGRYVGFFSKASNLVEGDTNNKSDGFVFDHQTGALTRISISSDGSQGNGDSGFNEESPISFSSDGNLIAFDSEASNLVQDDNNGMVDVFVHDQQSKQTQIVSLASDGTQGNKGGTWPRISGNGQFVVFQSQSSNLVQNDSNNYGDIFVHDRNSGITELVSVSSDGAQGNRNSSDASISADGRYVIFTSSADNLVPNDNNFSPDVFVHDRQLSTTKRISVATDGTEGDYESHSASISGDGRLIVFSSSASNLVMEDLEGSRDVFIHDQATGQTDILSLNMDGKLGNGDSTVPVISSDGKFVAFYSTRADLIENDTNSTGDIFLINLQTKQTQRVSIGKDGEEGNGESLKPSISQNGRFIAFDSEASNLVCGDIFHIRDTFVHDRFADNQAACHMRTFLPTANRNYCGPWFEDDFSNPGSGWPQTMTGSALYEYINGEYHINIFNMDDIAAASPDFQAENFIISVDVRSGGSVYGTYGILFGLAENWSHFYSYEIDTEGYYGIWRYSNSVGWELLWVDSSPYINLDGATNHLTVKRDGAMIEVYSNDHLLTTIYDGSYLGPGYVGLIASTFDEDHLNVFYDNFTIRPRTCNGVPQLLKSAGLQQTLFNVARDKSLQR